MKDIEHTTREDVQNRLLSLVKNKNSGIKLFRMATTTSAGLRRPIQKKHFLHLAKKHYKVIKEAPQTQDILARVTFTRDQINQIVNSHLSDDQIQQVGHMFLSMDTPGVLQTFSDAQIEKLGHDLVEATIHGYGDDNTVKIAELLMDVNTKKNNYHAIKQSHVEKLAARPHHV
jgi:hypothetical protein